MQNYKILIGCLSFMSWAFFTEASAQEVMPPNYDEIKQQITNVKSSSYYPILMDRYQQCDSTLSLEDYRNLYFGYVLLEDFIPYQEEDKALLEARKDFVKDGANAEACPSMLELAQKALANNPFDIPALAIIPICYYQMGDSTNFHLWDIKLHGVLDAISSSGDGETVQTALHVTNIEHEYELLNRLGWELDQIEVVDNQTDFLRVKENSDSIPGIYFNFGACGNVYREKYK